MSHLQRGYTRGAGVLAALVAGSMLAGCGSAATSDAGGSSARRVSSLSTQVDAAYDGTDKGNFKTLPEPTVKSGTSFKVGFLQTNGGQSFLLAMQKAAEAEVKKLGGTFIALDAASDPQKQASQLDLLISQHVDVIIGDPVVGNALVPGIAQAKKAGIPFVAIGSPADETKPPTPGAVTSISQGFDYSAYATMQALAAEHPHASFATMGLALPVEQLIFLLARIKYWGEHFGLKFLGEVDASGDTATGFGPAATTILTKYPSAQIVLTYNDPSAVAFATTAATSGKKVAVACPNASLSITGDALKAGRLDLVHRTPWEQEGVQSAIAAYDALTHQQPLPTFINVNGYVVSRKNVSQATWIQ